MITKEIAMSFTAIDMFRFFDRIEKTDTCWNWTGYIHPTQYGEFFFKNKNRKAHRILYAVLNEDFDENLVIDHICRNKKCVNPAHLRQVTNAINNTENSISPSAINKLKTHCKHGHEFNDKNTYRWKTSQRTMRVCRLCRRKRPSAKQR